jgi:lactoylglutathione lyase
MKTLSPVLMVKNVNETIKFYSEVLDFELIMGMPQEGDAYCFAILHNGNVEIMIEQQETLEEEISYFKEKPLGGTFTMYIETTDVENKHNVLKEKVTIVKELQETCYKTKEFGFTDNNGYVLVFAEKI